jgi:ribonucleoside-triphosphate reductase
LNREENEEEMTELPTPYQEYIHQSKYARWREDLGRRETWTETVDRYVDQLDRQLERKGASWIGSERADIRSAILNLEILPSMRALMTAGRALERDNVAGYNCSFMAVNRPRVWAEMLYVLCCGTGVGYSVERKEVAKLPKVPVRLTQGLDIVVRDSKVGWAEAIEQLVDGLYAGRIRRLDTSGVREAGAPLKTFGGRASGPEPLEALADHIVRVFYAARGRKLKTVEAHSISCKVGDIVVVGGVRRSALLALFDEDDQDMLMAKFGEWWDDPEREHFRLANNSVAYEAVPSKASFDAKWDILVKSFAGEPGIFNRDAARKKLDGIGRRSDFSFGVNPCGEIILRDRQFCNLTEVVIRATDTDEAMARKVRLATILGTIQASFTDFRFLSPEWKQNCEEEALLGVSLDGVQDNTLTSVKADPAELRVLLRSLRAVYKSANSEWAVRLGINEAAAGTCDKPSGNSSQLVNCSSGMHPRYGRFNIRRTRGSKNDPVSQVVYMNGVPTEDDVTSPERTQVFSWVQAAPEGAVTRHDVSAIQQLEHWLIYAEEWCEHNPSITVYYKEHEVEEVREWVYKHFDRIIGVTFLPFDDHTYRQAPYEEIDQATFDSLLADQPDTIDWSMLSLIETSDRTEGAKELACVSGACEIA